MNYLKILDVFIGNRCNLACAQCDTRSDLIRDQRHDPSLENILAGIDLARQNFQIETYSLLGGEPLLYLDKVERVIEHIRQIDSKARIVIPTNGSLIKKHEARIVKLVCVHRVDLYVCNHYAGFDRQVLSNKVKKDTKALAVKLAMTDYPLDKFLGTIFDLDNRYEDRDFDQWLTKRGIDLVSSNESLDEQVYANSSNYIWIRDQKEFHSNHFYDLYGKPKPFASGNAEQSYLKGCSSPCCNFLKDKKIYKCAALGTLTEFLDQHNSLNDPSWSKYLNYEPLDLEICNSNDIEQFNKSKFYAVPECDMCPANGDFIFTKTEDKVLPIKFYKDVQ